MIPRYLTTININAIPTIHTDVIVIGAGIAGLFISIQASEYKNVILITKKSLLDSNTQYAQGGIAAVISDDDSPQSHYQDTLVAGAGLCLPEAVNVLVHEGPRALHDLINMGTQFDIEDGQFALTKEGAHSQRRILHAHGDATGAEIIRALSKRTKESPKIEVWDEHFVIDLITENQVCYGALVQKPDGQYVLVTGDAVILCTGGAGQLYRYTTNPDIATGDGIAIAYRAGAQVQDVEFIQFHPTALCYPGAPRFLISEAVRGEGGVLRNIQGELFMEKYHPLKELAPRDIVARAIVEEIELTKTTFVYLDITHQPAELIKHRFPNIYEFCLKYGLDMTTDWIPVAPAAHYMMGGVKTDLAGETSIQRLFACGEVSSTGVHGANRLASNSLSEAIVYGRRIVERILQLTPVTEYPLWNYITPLKESAKLSIAEKKTKLQKIMLRYVGLKRNAYGLNKAKDELTKLSTFLQYRYTKREEFEFINLFICAHLVTLAALEREESRGGHYREDFPERNDDIWQKHIVFNEKQKDFEESVQLVKLE
jgi:L-aspartate oxidase